MTEIEIKLSCAERERLLAAFQDDLIRKAAVSAPKKMRMHSEYYDTPDAALYAAGLSLRFRRARGNPFGKRKNAKIPLDKPVVILYNDARSLKKWTFSSAGRAFA